MVFERGRCALWQRDRRVKSQKEAPDRGHRDRGQGCVGNLVKLKTSRLRGGDGNQDPVEGSGCFAFGLMEP